MARTRRAHSTRAPPPPPPSTTRATPKPAKSTSTSTSAPSRPIEDYALIGDTQTAALVARDGSIEWACFPRFDSSACFAALLGDRANGRWLIGTRELPRATRRRYRRGSLVLQTEIETATGVVRVIDFMPIRGDGRLHIVRIVEGVSGTVDMHLDLVVRFDMGRVVPWVRRRKDALVMTSGPDALCLRGDIDVHGEDLATVGAFTVRARERRAMVLTWFASHEPVPKPIDPLRALRGTETWWRSWSARCTYKGPWRDEVISSLRVLKALTFAPTGGIVAAPTTSLPEWPGGARNWDYRYCWLRDATLTLYAFMLGGYEDEAAAWREWLLRAAAGDPSELQIMYGVAGERRLTEYEAPWLSGYQGSKPVRIGNAAHEQLQLDVYGEVMDALYQARRLGVGPDPWSWPFEMALLDCLEQKWKEPDDGIWEVRGPKRHFTHSKVMAWVAFDRAIRSAEAFGFDGPVDRWRAVRDEIHAEVCARGYDDARATFTQSYGAPTLDASLLLLSLVGFLPASDPRIAGTVRAIERDLLTDGFVRRYRTDGAQAVDGLPAGEGMFLPCTFWLADVYVQLGRRDDARAIFDRLIGLRNDVGLLAEEYDPRARRLLGNFPQAFTHLSLVNTACNLTAHPSSPAVHRGDRHGDPESEARSARSRRRRPP